MLENCIISSWYTLVHAIWVIRKLKLNWSMRVLKAFAVSSHLPSKCYTIMYILLRSLTNIYRSFRFKKTQTKIINSTSSILLFVHDWSLCTLQPLCDIFFALNPLIESVKRFIQANEIYSLVMHFGIGYTTGGTNTVSHMSQT